MPLVPLALGAGKPFTTHKCPRDVKPVKPKNALVKPVKPAVKPKNALVKPVKPKKAGKPFTTHKCPRDMKPVKPAALVT